MSLEEKENKSNLRLILPIAFQPESSDFNFG